MSRAVVLPVLSLLGACEASESGRCWAEVDGKIGSADEVVRFTSIAEPAVAPVGLTDPLSLDLDPITGQAVFRVYDPTGKTLPCVQMETVKDPATGTSWVTSPSQIEDFGPYCVTCPQRTSVGVGAGLYVLPSSEPLPPPAKALSIRVGVRDCASLLPPGSQPMTSRLRIDTLNILFPIGGRPTSDQTEGVIPIEIAITQGSIFYDRSERVPEELQAALDQVNAMLRPGFLAVRLARVRRVEGEDPIVLPRGDYSTLVRMRKEINTCEGKEEPVRTDRISLVLAGCIKTTDPIRMQEAEPDGFVPHIPDGLLPSEQAQGIFIKGRGCALGGTPVAWAAQNLAKLIAHELGHYLGLYHSVEESGQTDSIADTGADNLMNFRPFSAATAAFTPGQFRVMRRHPVVRWDQL